MITLIVYRLGHPTVRLDKYSWMHRVVNIYLD